jgi:hypothetical protein
MAGHDMSSMPNMGNSQAQTAPTMGQPGHDMANMAKPAPSKRHGPDADEKPRAKSASSPKTPTPPPAAAAKGTTASTPAAGVAGMAMRHVCVDGHDKDVSS